METWRKINGYDNYSVSDLGNVRNDKTVKILTNVLMKTGYHKINLCKNGLVTEKLVHKLVSDAFIDNPLGKKYVDHIDGNKTNNNVNNLRRATNTENMSNTGLRKDNKTGIKGVIWNKKSEKWKAYIQLNGILIHLGYFNTIEEAKEARQRRANEAFGVFTNACEKI